ILNPSFHILNCSEAPERAATVQLIAANRNTTQLAIRPVAYGWSPHQRRILGEGPTNAHTYTLRPIFRPRLLHQYYQRRHPGAGPWVSGSRRLSRRRRRKPRSARRYSRQKFSSIHTTPSD